MSTSGEAKTGQVSGEFGTRGEAWVAGQLALFGTVLLAGIRGRRWPKGTRTITRLASLAAGAGGAYMMQSGAQALGKQLTPLPAPTETGELKTDGVYGVVRHPIYTGVLGLAASWALLRSPKAVPPTLALYAFFVAKSAKEEEWLEKRYPEYNDYRKRVPSRIIPGVD